MRIESVEIANFKNLRRLRIDGLPDLVIIAGTNGAGKSALFDALRIWKESLAGYSLLYPGQSYIHHLLPQVGPVITIGEQEATITVSIKVSDDERRIIGLPEYQPGTLTQTITIRPQGVPYAGATAPEAAYTSGPQIDYPYLKLLLGERYHEGSGLGVVDHIGSDRRFAAAQVGSINLSPNYAERELQTLVVNSVDKFANLSTDLVHMHLLDMQERVYGQPEPHRYIEGVRDIFRHFLPDKELLDVNIPPGLASPPRILVRSGGVEHDINQLSSGQREILMTYTHLEKLRPTGSIILFDEPELHLHPALQRRVIGYLRRLLARSSNQIWVITHSEEIVSTTEYESLFAMTGTGDPAVVPVRQRAERTDLLQQLGASVGLQLVSPRILFLEGESDEDILPLFFEVIPGSVSLVPTGSKSKLMRLTPSAMALLDQTITEGRFYFVRDRDVEEDPDELDELERKHSGYFFTWERYHIENYLLDEEAIYRVLADDPDLPTPASVADVGVHLRAIADELRDGVLAKHLESKLNAGVRKRVVLNAREGVRESLVKAAAARLSAANSLLDPRRVEDLYADTDAELAARWPAEWKSLCVGREVLRAYHNRFVRQYLGYVPFRNRVGRKVRDLGRVPEEIRRVMAHVTADLPKLAGPQGGLS